MLKKDNIIFGAVIGLVLPGLFYGLLTLLSLLVTTGSPLTRPFEPDRLTLLAIFINLVPIRMYFVSWKLDKTGRGVLLVTFLLVMAYFIFNRYL